MGLLLVSLLVCVSAVQLDIHLRVSSSVAAEVSLLAAMAPHNQIDFVKSRDGQEQQVLALASKAVSQVSQPCKVMLQGVSGAGTYALWSVVNNVCLQALSDAVVAATFHLATPNQPIPPWVQSLPEPERERKISMMKLYGSPNVFSQFQPHVTVAYDEIDNLSEIYQSVAGKTASYMAATVEVSLVGPFGTVQKNGTVGQVSIPPSKKKLFRGLRKSRTRLSRDDCRPEGGTNWDYMLMVREWPGTMTPGPLPSYVNTFTMHGLWPTRNDGSYPACCNNNYPFSYSEIAPIISDVNRVWYDTLHDVSNGTDFWSHEWDKHGTCAMAGDSSCCGSERAYFQTVINLHDNMTEVKWLASAGIVPADPSSTTYKTDDFVNAIAAGLGQTPLIRCTTDNNGNTVIEDIGVCVDKNLNIIACPSSASSEWQQEEKCGDSFGYPIIPH